jgi:hypothetical protein
MVGIMMTSTSLQMLLAVTSTSKTTLQTENNKEQLNEKPMKCLQEKYSVDSSKYQWI